MRISIKNLLKVIKPSIIKDVKLLWNGEVLIVADNNNLILAINPEDLPENNAIRKQIDKFLKKQIK